MAPSGVAVLLALCFVCVRGGTVDVGTDTQLAAALARHAAVAAAASTIRVAAGLYHTPLRLTAAHSGLTVEGAAGGGAVVLRGTHTVRGAARVTLRRLSLVAAAAALGPAPALGSHHDEALLVQDAEGVEVDSCTIEGGVKVDGGAGHRVHHSRITNRVGTTGHCVWIASCGDMAQVIMRLNAPSSSGQRTGSPVAPCTPRCPTAHAQKGGGR